MEINDEINVLGFSGRIKIGNHGVYVLFSGGHFKTCAQIARILHVPTAHLDSWRYFINEINIHGCCAFDTYFPEFESIDALLNFISYINLKNSDSVFIDLTFFI